MTELCVFHSPIRDVRCDGHFSLSALFLLWVTFKIFRLKFFVCIEKREKLPMAVRPGHILIY